VARKDIKDKEAEFLAQAMREAGARSAAPIPLQAPAAAAKPQLVAPPPPRAPLASAPPLARPDPALILELARAEAEQRRRSSKKRWMVGLLAVTAMALLWAVVNLVRLLLR
jgi:hypothetical protein